MKVCNLPLVLLSVATLVACQPKQAGQETSDAEDMPPPTIVKPSVAASSGFSEQFRKTTEAYMAVKDAFVKSDTAAVNRAADALMQAVAHTQTNGEAQQKWNQVKPMLMRTISGVRGMSELADKRAAFEDLSKIMYEAVNAFGASATVYKQYCPMAFDDKGAYWLSLNAEIRNPYFGDEMLECGEVQQVLTFEE